jgi:TonB family protein
MTVVVRTDGTPSGIEITESLDTEHGLDKQAVAALSQWLFEPGRKDGKPVPVRVTVEMRFTLRKYPDAPGRFARRRKHRLQHLRPPGHLFWRSKRIGS